MGSGLLLSKFHLESNNILGNYNATLGFYKKIIKFGLLVITFSVVILSFFTFSSKSDKRLFIGSIKSFSTLLESFSLWESIY